MKNDLNAKQSVLAGIFGALIGFVNGFLGGGGGMICVPFFKKIYRYDEKQAHATTILVILPLCLVSSFVYINSCELDFVDLMLVTLGGVIGGTIGSLFLKKINAKWLNIIFATIMLLGGIKMVI